MTVDTEKMKALALAATPGPWQKNCGNFNVIAPNESNAGLNRYHVCMAEGRDYPQMSRNAEFIAACRTAVPELIAEVERLRAAANVRETPWYLAACRMGNTLYNISQHDDLPAKWKATCREMVDAWDESRKEIGAHTKAGKPA
jgi:hypothetical protein